MPGSRMHITGSTVVGAAYAAAAWYVGGMPPTTCLLAAGLCAVAGILPDLDDGEGESLGESVGFAAMLLPLLLIHRFENAGMPLEAIVLAGAAIYLSVRYGLAWILENHSVHRGMLHSLPTAVVAGEVAYLAFGAEDPVHRYFIASAVVIGFLSHLVLDEIWSVTQGHFGPKHKTGFGTALKCWGKEPWSNLLAYVLVVALGVLAAFDAHWSERTLPQRRYARQQMEQAARSMQATPAPWNYRR